MGRGAVNANREAVIRLGVRDANGQAHERDAIVDTGFNGWLTLPPDFIVLLGLRWLRVGTAVLADGRQGLFDIYGAMVLWDGRPMAIPVDETESEPLIGMSLMYGYELNVQMLEGGAVTLKRIAGPLHAPGAQAM